MIKEDFKIKIIVGYIRINFDFKQGNQYLKKNTSNIDYYILKHHTRKKFEEINISGDNQLTDFEDSLNKNTANLC